MVRGRCLPLTSCGISTPFGVLFPTARQVIHALLTRPPLRHSIHSTVENRRSLSGFAAFYHSVNRVSPFDLHVLGAPPAFVLSQDQTLRKWYFSTPSGMLKPFPSQSDLFSKKFPNSFRFLETNPVVKGLVSQCCLIFKVRAALSSELCYLITYSSICQQQIFSDAAEL